MEIISVLMLIFSMILMVITYAYRDLSNEREIYKFMAFAITITNLTLFAVVLKLGDIVHILKGIIP